MKAGHSTGFLKEPRPEKWMALLRFIGIWTNELENSQKTRWAMFENRRGWEVICKDNSTDNCVRKIKLSAHKKHYKWVFKKDWFSVEMQGGFKDRETQV
jgi:hypothetical protein